MDYVKELVEYWRTNFDWRAQEKLINSLSHFKADVDGMGVHFIHERGKGPNPMPLVITHGWPGTFFEMYKVIPMLSDPASHGGDPRGPWDRGISAQHRGWPTRAAIPISRPPSHKPCPTG